MPALTHGRVKRINLFPRLSSMHNLVVIKIPKRKPQLEKHKDIINKLNMINMVILHV